MYCFEKQQGYFCGNRTVLFLIIYYKMNPIIKIPSTLIDVDLLENGNNRHWVNSAYNRSK